MDSISSLGGPSQPILNPSSRNAAQRDAAGRSHHSPNDRVELSDAARLLSRLSELPAVRQDLVDRVRAQIDAGTYETPDKIDATTAAVFEELNG